jgi:tetratricopeptide (TPR) repeat protein
MTLIKPLIFFLMMFAQFLSAQNNDGSKQDSLDNKTFEYFQQAIISNRKDTIKSTVYAKKWLEKAKQQSDYRQMASAYKNVMYLSDKKWQLQYADSSIFAAKKTNDNVLIGGAYMTKATVFYGKKEHSKALDNFLLADQYISKTKDEYSIHKVKYGIAQTKYYLGFYDEAISLFRECIDFFKEENDRAYLNSLHNLGLCYNRIGNYAWCTITNQTGIDEGIRLGNREMEPYFMHSEGVNQCGKKNFKVAIDKLTSVLPAIKNNKDFANVSVAYFYMGKSFWSLKQEEKAVTLFKKVDEIYDAEKYLRPDQREAYEKIIDYYKAKEDTDLQLHYINKLLKIDLVIGQKYKYLLNKMVKEYDTKELLKSKNDLENKMKFRTILGFCIIGVLVTAITVLIYKQNSKIKRFEAIMNRDTSKAVIPKSETKNTTQEISQEIETGILKKLEKFEVENRYLEKDMNLARMATLLNTNTKYVTKIIAKHREKRYNRIHN